MAERDIYRRYFAQQKGENFEHGIEKCSGATDKEAQYDASAKRLLGQKWILAHILVKTVDAFKGMRPGEVIGYIEGTPQISTVSIEPGLTNQKKKTNGQRIVGFNTENGELGEGLVRFDIVFYGSRLISSQKERDFENSNYDDLRQVYSIWICMNMDENSMCHVHLVEDQVIGGYVWKGNLDLLHIIMIGLAKELPEHDETYELHRLLGALLSKQLTGEEKLNIMGQEYNIPIEENLRKDVNDMCNLSQGIKEDGIAIGREEGRAEGEAGIILKMYKNGFSAEQIAAATDKEVEAVRNMIAGKKAILV